uniref:Ubiquitin domain containing 2 n=2 Tax=Estrildinae TaxID=40155 RepID=A0A674HMZ9_TAEGU
MGTGSREWAQGAGNEHREQGMNAARHPGPRDPPGLGARGWPHSRCRCCPTPGAGAGLVPVSVPGRSWCRIDVAAVPVPVPVPVTVLGRSRGLEAVPVRCQSQSRCGAVPVPVSVPCRCRDVPWAVPGRAGAGAGLGPTAVRVGPAGVAGLGAGQCRSRCRSRFRCRCRCRSPPARGGPGAGPGLSPGLGPGPSPSAGPRRRGAVPGRAGPGSGRAPGAALSTGGGSAAIAPARPAAELGAGEGGGGRLGGGSAGPMGGCVGSHHDSSGSLNENSDGTGVALGRNQPLKKEKPKWKSDYPMTDGQLRSKRDEFWDTAPAFEGRKEIWDALKAAAHAFESNDHELAQAIIDGANITLPHGALTECYDELGNRYQLPVYCLAPPINMIEEKGDLETLDIPDPPPNSGHECQLRLRLSTGKDLKLQVRSMDSVYHMKRRLHAVEGVEPGSQRWFFSGRPLADKMKLEELKIPKDYVVQVIVSQPLANPTPVEN